MYHTIQKTIAAWAFNRYIACYYFDEVNVDQLKVAFEKGEVELKDLPIKKEALGQLNLPLEVTSGIVGSLSIKVPISTPLSEPWIIKIKNLRLDVELKQLSPEEKTDDYCQSTANESFEDLPDSLNPEETMLAEFYSSFSATVTSIVRDIYKSIRLEMDTLTVNYGKVRFKIDNVIIHQPKTSMEQETKIESTFTKISITNTVPKHQILDCDHMKMELKLNSNTENEGERNLNIKMDLNGPRYMHSKQIYEQMKMKILEFFEQKSNKKKSYNKLLVVNIEEGRIFVVDDATSTSPVLKLTFDDLRLLQFSDSHQRNGLMFANLGCDYFNREILSWDTFMRPWPLHFSWEHSSTNECKQMSLNSDEQAELILSNSFLDLYDMTLKRMIDEYLHPWSSTSRIWSTTPSANHHHGRPAAPSPRKYKYASYNHSVNLSERIARRISNPFERQEFKDRSNLNMVVPGVKITLVNNRHENLIDMIASGILVEYSKKNREQIIDCSVHDIRIENLLTDCEREIVLDRAPPNVDESLQNEPALRLIMDRVLGNSFAPKLFKNVQLSTCELVLNIEEKLVLKLVEFFKFRNMLIRQRKKMINVESAPSLAKYYFDFLKIDINGLRLSFLSSAKTYSFEDAHVELSSYVTTMNISRTLKDIFDSVVRFYKRQIIEQVQRIVVQNYFRYNLSDLLSTLYDEVYNRLFN